jgi:hypothetical protein
VRNDLTDITLIVDRSGSMAGARSKDATVGINNFIDEQKKAAGEAVLTLVQFDTEYEALYRGKPIKDVGAYELRARGGTALLDAIGKTILETGTRLAALPEDQRPGLVVFFIVTDGEENSSREFGGPGGLERVRDMIKHQEETYSWHFIFLGSDPSTFDAGQAMGFTQGKVASYTPQNTRAVYSMASSKLGMQREELTAGGIVLPDAFDYTDQERADLTK